jgi:hypothetical protein
MKGNALIVKKRLGALWLYRNPVISHQGIGGYQDLSPETGIRQGLGIAGHTGGKNHFPRLGPGLAEGPSGKFRAIFEDKLCLSDELCLPDRPRICYTLFFQAGTPFEPE